MTATPALLAGYLTVRGVAIQYVLASIPTARLAMSALNRGTPGGTVRVSGAGLSSPLRIRWIREIGTTFRSVVQLPASIGVRRRIVVRPASVGSFQDRDVQLHLAGIEIAIETESYGQSNSSQQYFLSKEEAAWLVRALQGSLAISFEQYHWDLDVT